MITAAWIIFFGMIAWAIACAVYQSTDKGKAAAAAARKRTAEKKAARKAAWRDARIWW